MLDNSPDPKISILFFDFLSFPLQTVECFDTFKEEWRRVASMDIGRILPGIAILSGQVAPHQGHDWDDNRQRRFIGRILSGIELFLRLRFPCLKLKYDRPKCFFLKKKMTTVNRLTIFLAVLN